MKGTSKNKSRSTAKKNDVRNSFAAAWDFRLPYLRIWTAAHTQSVLRRRIPPHEARHPNCCFHWFQFCWWFPTEHLSSKASPILCGRDGSWYWHQIQNAQRWPLSRRKPGSSGVTLIWSFPQCPQNETEWSNHVWMWRTCAWSLMKLPWREWFPKSKLDPLSQLHLHSFLRRTILVLRRPQFYLKSRVLQLLTDRCETIMFVLDQT